MSLDGREHRASPLVYPAHHHPKASHTGIVYSRALSAAYCATQFGASKVLERYASFDMRRGLQFYTQDFLPIAAGYRRVLGTHLVAEIAFAAAGIGAAPKADHRISAVGNAVTVNGSTASLPIASHAANTWGTDRAKVNREFSERDIFSGDKFSFSARCEVELDPDQRDHDLHVVVEGNAYDDGVTAGGPLPYYLLHLIVWQEFR